MPLTRRQIVALATLGSAGLLGGALFFQYVVGLPPCPLCIWQRWPHVAAMLLGGAALAVPLLAPAAVPLAALALLIGAGIAGYHVGVEQGLWESVTCGVPEFTGLSPAQMLEALQRAPVVRCDEIPWALFGMSMAGWNGIISLALAALFFAAALAKPRPA